MAIQAVIATVAVVGGLSARNQQKKAAEAQRRGAKLERRSASLRNVSARRKRVRQTIIEQQRSLAQAEAKGIGGASTTAVEVAGLQTQLGSNVSLQTTLEDLNTSRLKTLDRAAQFQSNAQEIGLLTDVSTSILSAFKPKPKAASTPG